MSLDSSDAPQGAAFRLNAFTDGWQDFSTLAVAPDGHFIAAWFSKEQDGSDWGSYARVFEADGAPRTGELALNERTEGVQALPAVALAADGRFVAVWQEQNPADESYGVKGRRYDADGNPLSGEALLFNYGANGTQSFVGTSDAGAFVVTTVRKNDASGFIDVIARRFDADGNALCPGD